MRTAGTIRRGVWVMSAGYVGLMVLAGPMVVARMQTAQDGATGRSVHEAVYTAGQADRGRREYDEYCGTCHAPDLSGNSTYGYPPLVGEVFINRWIGRSVGDLWSLIRKTMPQNAPESLGEQNYLDIVAFVLSANDYPAGAQELRAGPTNPNDIIIRPVR